MVASVLLPFCFRFASVVQGCLQVLNAGRLTHIGVGAQNGPWGSKRLNATLLLPFCFRYAKAQGTPLSLGITRDNASHLTRVGVASVLLPFCFRFDSVVQGCLICNALTMSCVIGTSAALFLGGVFLTAHILNNISIPATKKLIENASIKISNKCIYVCIYQ